MAIPWSQSWEIKDNAMYFFSPESCLTHNVNDKNLLQIGTAKNFTSLRLTHPIFFFLWFYRHFPHLPLNDVKRLMWAFNFDNLQLNPKKAQDGDLVSREDLKTLQSPHLPKCLGESSVQSFSGQTNTPKG